MRLLKAGLWGYRRFEAAHPDMDVSEKVVAIVGPNEAGKTSFLRALLHLNGEGFEPNELTRKGDGKVCVRSTYALDEEDRAAIAHLDGAAAVIRLDEWIRETGTLHRHVKPTIMRDLAPRTSVHDALAKVLDGKWIKGLEESEHEGKALVSPFRAALEVLALDEQTLSDEQVQTLAAAMATDFPDAPPSVEKIVESLSELVTREQRPEPGPEAARILGERTPRFLFFDDANRVLASQYDVNTAPTEALANLLDLAAMGIRELRQAIASGDQSRVEEVLEAANNTLKARFDETWQQSGTFVRLRVDGDQLHVFASNKPGDYIAISERSDGLRQFVALYAYVERYNDRPAEPILLVDEAERHLHYDAQADLVRAFTRQTSAAKVIYTTHSAGCLPQDLGNGVRIIEPVGPDDQPPDTWDRSRIRNWFWTDGPGFGPLLIGMGASALAFSATQRAVMTEGIVDAMLMPTLFREATNNQDVGFQVAPSLAEITPEAIKDIDLMAARVAYLLDADDGGRAHKQKLLDAGIPENRIVLLPAAEGETSQLRTWSLSRSIERQ